MTSPALIDVTASSDPRAAVAPLELEHKSVLLLLGSFDPALNPQVRSLCTRAIAPAAFCANALVVNDGGSSVFASLMEAAVQELEHSPKLLGIIDAAEVDPAHEPAADYAAVLRIAGPAAASSKMRFQLIAALAEGTGEPVLSSTASTSLPMLDGSGPGKGDPESTAELPAVAILVGGAEADRLAILRCIRRRWPVVIFQGGGGLGDEILDAMAQAASVGSPVATPDVSSAAAAAAPEQCLPPCNPELREIVESEAVCRLPLDGPSDDLERVLLELLHRPTETLADAWSRFDDYDHAAEEKQKVFRVIQVSTLSLAVFATLLAIVKTAVDSNQYV